MNGNLAAYRPVNKLEWAVIALWISFWIFAVSAALMYPGTIPMHYDAAGQPDRYATFPESMIIPALASAANVLLLYLAHFMGREGTYGGLKTRDVVFCITISVNLLFFFMMSAIIWTSI